MSPVDKRLLGLDNRDTKSQIALGVKDAVQKMQETPFYAFNKTENNSSLMSNLAAQSALQVTDNQQNLLSHRDQSGLTQQPQNSD